MSCLVPRMAGLPAGGHESGVSRRGDSETDVYAQLFELCIQRMT